jgi:hypothetical protein
MKMVTNKLARTRDEPRAPMKKICPVSLVTASRNLP